MLSDKSYRVTFFLILLLLFVGFAAAQVAGRTAPPRSKSSTEDEIVTNVWAAEADDHGSVSGHASGELLSRDFAAAALSSTGVLTRWQEDLAYIFQNGYPLSESAITLDRNRAVDSLRLAALAAANESDCKALQEVVNLFSNLRLWSDTLLDANRNLDLAQFYMSPDSVNEDPQFQKIARCEAFLGSMLASRQLAQAPSCQ